MSITFSVVSAQGNELRPDLSINLANGNALQLMAMVGLQPEYCGTIQDLAATERRCLDVLNVLRPNPELDAGRRDAVTGGDGYATVIDCAQPDGYFTTRVEQLRALCETALLADGVVVFG